MALSSVEIVERIKNPKRSAEIQQAILHQNKLQFHAQTVTDKSAVSHYYKEYLAWVKTVITAKDKYRQFENLLTFPMASNDIIDTISDEYLRLFNAQDSYFEVSFSDTAHSKSYLDYLEELELNNFFTNEVFSSMLTAVNSLVVIDLQQQQQHDTPQPYFYLLDIGKVIDINFDSAKNSIDFVLFKEGQDIIAIDNIAYRRYAKAANGNYYLTIENFHDIGYCPVTFMWDDNLNAHNPYLKQSPISGQLGRLDWYLFVETAKKSLDIYASYPIYWSYKSKCQYRNEEGNPCEEGFTLYTSAEGTSNKRACPACEANKLVGAGSIIQVPAPRNPNDPDLREPVGKVTVDKEALDFNVYEVRRLADHIIQLSTGKSPSGVLNKKSINEDQVHSQFESQTNILRYLAQNFEKLHTWMVNTLGRIIYGDTYLGCSISYGTKFYLQSELELLAELKSAKEAGLPMYLLAQKKSIIEDYLLKNNPKSKIKIEILKYLEPYSDLNLDECVRLGLNEADFEAFALKANFSYFVNKFEIEHGALTEWGIKLSISEKINRITQVLKKYVKEQFKN